MAPWRGGPRRRSEWRSSLSPSHVPDRVSWTWSTWDIGQELNRGDGGGGNEEEDGRPKQWWHHVLDPLVR
ncbi:hypothetical protein E2562_023104 [Oryza meyeriana var. granulata]|uniref:Uncharacterized protein n=1 Tax=Oryza meyeriana var. granulata TaxID=110450 RepID=A0A6G1DZ53_9ORYZ|nr:hypothetical protein E2562_023104 [Oryza meyeriana var. granulata]